MALNEKVAVQSDQIAALAREWPVIEALMGGTSAMRAAGEKLLPKNTNEEKADYDKRLAVSVLFPAFRRTVRVMAGKPFSKPLTLKDAAPEIEAWCEDVDREGVDLHSFAAEMFAEGLAYGLAGILVDAPPPVAPTGAVATKKEQDKAGRRPYFVRVMHNQILGYRVEMVDGARRFTQLRLKEFATEPDGDFGDKTITQVRVLEPGSWRIYRVDDKGNWLIHQQGATDLDYVPFVPLYGERTGFMQARPPLLELAHQNVQHWQSSSDQHHILHVARVPILAVLGGDDKTELTVGAKTAVFVPTGGDLKWVEHEGKAIAAGQTSIEALEAQMIQSGAELLVKRPGARTATETANDAEGNRSDLQRMVEGFEDALEQALLMMAELGGVEKAKAGEVEMFKDFGVDLGGVSATLMKDLALGGIIANSTAIEELKRRGELSGKVDPEAEAVKVAEQGDPLGTITDPAMETPPKEPQGQDDPLAADPVA